MQCLLWCLWIAHPEYMIRAAKIYHDETWEWRQEKMPMWPPQIWSSQIWSSLCLSAYADPRFPSFIALMDVKSTINEFPLTAWDAFVPENTDIYHREETTSEQCERRRDRSNWILLRNPGARDRSFTLPWGAERRRASFQIEQLNKWSVRQQEAETRSYRL